MQRFFLAEPPSAAMPRTIPRIQPKQKKAHRRNRRTDQLPAARLGFGRGGCRLARPNCRLLVFQAAEHYIHRIITSRRRYLP